MKVGIIGATGAVGQQMIQCIEERNIEIEELRLFASPRSEGKKQVVNGKEITIQVVKEGSFDGLDVVLGATSNAMAKEYAPAIKAAGALFIDNSSAFRLMDDVPLVIPNINREDIFKHNGIIANPNCSTIITCMAVNGINRISKIKAMIASTYQAVSGAGQWGIVELGDQIKAIEAGEPFETKTFPHQIAYNCIPCIGSFKDDMYTTEEVKMENEGRKIMHLPELNVTCTCVRVPVYRSHSISVSLALEKPITLEEAKAAINAEKYLSVVDDGLYPMPLRTTDTDNVEVGRLRYDHVLENGIALWCCGDQIRTGAASNAVSIMQAWMEGQN